MHALSALLVVGLATAWVPAPTPARALLRARLRARLSAHRLEVSVPKPLGVVLEEVEPDAARGVYAIECDEASAAYAAGVRAGDKIIAVTKRDATGATFDQVMNVLVGADSPVALTLEREGDAPAAAPEPAAAAAAPAADKAGRALIEVVDQKGASSILSAEAGTLLRTALLDNGVDLYSFVGKMTNCVRAPPPPPPRRPSSAVVRRTANPCPPLRTAAGSAARAPWPCRGAGSATSGKRRS